MISASLLAHAPPLIEKNYEIKTTLSIDYDDVSCTINVQFDIVDQVMLNCQEINRAVLNQSIMATDFNLNLDLFATEIAINQSTENEKITTGIYYISLNINPTIFQLGHTDGIRRSKYLIA